MPAKRVPIEKHPGFYEQGRSVVFPYRDRQGKQHWGKARTVTEAKRAKAAIETDVARGEYRPQARVGFATYARTCMGAYQGRTSKAVDPITRADYLARLEQDAIPFFKEIPLSSIEPSNIKGFCAHVAARAPSCMRCRGRGRDSKGVECKGCKGTGEREGLVSANTVRLALAPLKLVFATAFEDGVIRVNPAAGVRVLTPRATVDELDDEGPVKAMTEKEAAAILAAIAGKKSWARWWIFFVLLLELGLRIGELVELRWKDVDLDAGTVRVRRGFYRGRVGAPKTKFGRRTLRLTPNAKAELEALRGGAGDEELVVTSVRGGRVDASNLMERVLKPAAAEAGVGEWVGFHTFRHTCATLLFTKAKWNPKQVQLWLGHHSAAFTVDRYVHLLPSDLPPAVELAGAPQLRLIEGGGNTGVTEPRAKARTQVAS